MRPGGGACADPLREGTCAPGATGNV